VKGGDNFPHLRMARVDANGKRIKAKIEIIRTFFYKLVLSRFSCTRNIVNGIPLFFMDTIPVRLTINHVGAVGVVLQRPKFHVTTLISCRVVPIPIFFSSVDRPCVTRKLVLHI
jgi:hypothetical protein